MALGRMQNLMTSAGEALGLTEDPLHTIIGEKVTLHYALRNLITPPHLKCFASFGPGEAWEVIYYIFDGVWDQ